MKMTKYNRPNELFRFFDDNFTKAAHGNGVTNRPVVNIMQTEDAYHLEMAAPGRKKDDFKLEVSEQVLTVSYEAKEAKEEDKPNFLRREYSLNSFKRSFHLDEKVIDDEAIAASYEDGILRVSLPKREEALTKGPKLISVE
jgi:HSP20 family protein